MLWRHYRNEKADGGELSAFCCVGRGEGTLPYEMALHGGFWDGASMGVYIVGGKNSQFNPLVFRDRFV